MSSNQKYSREILGAKRVLVLQLENQSAMEDDLKLKNLNAVAQRREITVTKSVVFVKVTWKLSTATQNPVSIYLNRLWRAIHLELYGLDD